MIDSLIQAFAGPGALFMYAVTGVLAFGLAVAVERLYTLFVRMRVDEAGVLAALGKNDLEAAREACGAHPVGALIVAGGAADDADGAWDRMTAEASLLERDVRERVPYLATVGNVATMLGLLGTVYGLILAFTGLGDASAVERAQKLSEGIATAMSTTAFGLLVGIPALALHAFLDGRANRILRFCESVAARVATTRRGA